MTIFRRRTLFWLIKAYLKKWGKVIGSSFLLGLLVFFVLLAVSQYVISKLPNEKKTVIGLIGAYTTDNLPPTIVRKLSSGLTTVATNGTVQPGAAESWEITDLGKTYIFHLKKNVRFTNDQLLTSDKVNYGFADVTVETPDKNTIVFKLKDAYSPFLITISRPIFINGFIGIGDYRLSNVKVNGNFVESLSLRSVRGPARTEKYKFYPDESALKHAFLLGEINTAVGLTDVEYKQTTLASFPNVKVTRGVDYSKLVTLFFDTQDSVLSDKKLRNGLSYALPDTFKRGQRNHVSYPPTSEYFSGEENDRKQDYAHAKLLIDSATKSASASSMPKLTMKVLTKYMPVAEEIQQAWKKAGVAVKLEEVQVIPTSFQMYLGDFNMPRDPDQYTLWHSSQPPNTNITNFNNLRIDKLLEDGRKTTDLEERKKIYADFQKYLVDDDPAAFLYFPYEYTLQRK